MDKHNLKSLYAPLLLILVCFVAYLPLSTFLFALKNDAFIYNFPNKYFFSECLAAGVLPTWNPYLNFGFPLFADPGFAWWNPITWIFGLLGYNAFTFTIEVLLYIYIAGLGMYWLGKTLGFQTKTALAMGCMFMCSGFFIGNLQHINFITCAAFLPWLLGSWVLYQQNTTSKNLFLCCVSAYLLFTAGHPAIPIATIYFLVIITIIYYFNNRKQIHTSTFLISQIKLTLGITLFLLPLIFSYCSILPNYSRSEPPNQLDSTNVGFTLQSFISFFAPFATIKNNEWFATDVSMRNAYFSLLGVLTFLMSLSKRKMEQLQYTLLIAGILMLFISAGGALKKTIYEFTPGLNFIRTNGEFRVFTIFAFIICGAYILDRLFSNARIEAQRLKKWIVFSAPVFLILSISLQLIFSHSIQFSQLNFTVDDFKHYLDNITFFQSFSIALFLSAILLVFYWLVLGKRKLEHLLFAVLLLDLFLNSWLLLPVTGVGRTSAGAIQTIINKGPRGFPIPYMDTSKSNKKTYLSDNEIRLIGDWGWYNKEIVHPKIDYPSHLKNSENHSSPNEPLNKLKPFLYLKDQNIKGINITSFSPNYIKHKIITEHPDTLILLQNNFDGWKTKVDGSLVSHLVLADNLMAIQLNKGEHIVEWEFAPPIIILISIWLLSIVLFFWIHKLGSNREILIKERKFIKHLASNQ
jgi:hypothetical protein